MDNQIFNLAKDFLIKKLDPVFIIAFGSSVSGNTHSESDIDLAFFSEKSINSYDLFILSQELAELLNIEVDLVNIKDASTVFKAQIISTGRLLYSRDETFRRNIEMIAFSMYARLNEERKKVIEYTLKKGSIYGK